RADHGEDAGQITLVEQMDGEARAGEVRDDRTLDVGEGEDEGRLQRADFFHVRGGERRDARLLLAHLWRAHGVARDADDAILLAEEVEGLYGLLGQADDALGWKAPQRAQAEMVAPLAAGFTSERATAARWIRRKP